MTEVPVGFPAELTREVRLADGRQVLLRPVLPSDEQELRRAVAEADPETLRLRFLGGRPPRSDADFAHLVQVDYDQRFAVVAVSPRGEGVGIARYERLRARPETAEVAVAVEPAWRHVGLATALVTLLGQAAQQRGVRAFEAEFFADNLDVTDLLTEAGLHYVRTEDAGVVTVDVALPDPQRG